MRAPLPIAGLIGIIAACSPEQSTAPPDSQTDTGKGAAPAAAPSPALPPSGRVSEYTSLKDCRITTSKPDEAGFTSSACPGVAGFTLRLIEADARQNLFVKDPSGKEYSLKLSEAAGSGFSRIGERIEWRGTLEAGTFRPDAMVLRYFVVEREGEGETAYLLPVSLAANRPCVTGRIAPGRQQNEQARLIIDGEMACRDSSGG